MDFLPEQHAEKLREMERQLSRPSPLFLSTVAEVAQKLGLDADKLVAGEAVLLRGIIFHLVHYGQADADGLTLFVQIGAVPESGEAESLRSLLEHNVTSPGAGGVYGLMPGTDTVVNRTRIDLARSAAPAADVMRQIEAFAVQFEAITGMTQAAIELAKLYPEGAITGDIK
jgi:hypothetical protein